MSIFTTVIRCGICGEPLTGAGNPYVCGICGNTSYTTNPALEDELRTANAMRECTRFDEAMLLYKQIVKKYKNEDLSEVYWNQLLCEQHVMFEADEKGERFPSFYAIVSDDVEDSPYYTCAVAAAEKHAPERVKIFGEMAEKMVRAKQLYSRIRESAKPYDVFICFKKSKLDGSGNTPDTDLAIDLYNHFAKDYKIFFSERSLRDVVVRDFEPNIYYALYSAKVMLVLCSKREYVDSQWVHNEWSRYHAFAQNPAAGKTIIPIFLEDFSPANLPTELLSYQGLADNRHLFDDLDRTLRKILRPVDTEAMLRQMQEQVTNLMAAQAAPRQVPAEPVRRPAPPASRFSAEEFDMSDTVLDKYVGKSSEVIIPDGVSEISTCAFDKCTFLTSVKIPASVKKIDRWAFDGCTALESVTLEEGLESICEKAFRGCESLKELRLPSTLTEIGERAFEGCKSLTGLSLPDGIKEIPRAAFHDCAKLSGIKLPDGLRKIGPSAFWDCVELTSLSVPEGVSVLGDAVLRGCRSLKSIKLPSTLEKIDEWALEGCRRLVDINLPEGLTVIGTYAFSECAALREIVLPSTLSDIEPLAFNPCKGLERITILSPDTSIGDVAFFGCDALTTVYCAPTLVGAMKEAFDRPDEVKFLPLGAPAPATPKPAAVPKSAAAPTPASAPKPTPQSDFKVVNGVLEKYFGGELDVVIPDGVTTIGAEVFKSNNMLSVVIPASVTTIEKKAFSNCSALINVRIADGSQLSNIAPNAFEWCEKLIEIHNGSSLSIKAGATSWGGIAAYAKCVHKNATAKSFVLEKDDQFVFYDDGKFRSLLRYMGLHKIIELPANCNGHPYEIASHAFADRGDLTRITLPSGITAIGSAAFWRCTGLTELKIPPTVKSIGKHAFGFCEKLESVTLPPSVTEIGESAFCWCKSLRSVNDQSSVKKIPEGLYGGCEKLVHIKLPLTVTEVDKEAFNMCKSLEVLEFSPATSSVRYRALAACDALREIYCPRAIKGEIKERLKQDTTVTKFKIHIIK